MLKEKIAKIENGCCALLEHIYEDECRGVARQCVLEGYPSHGENYELRINELWFGYYEEEYLILLQEVGRIEVKC